MVLAYGSNYYMDRCGMNTEDNQYLDMHGECVAYKNDSGSVKGQMCINEITSRMSVGPVREAEITISQCRTGCIKGYVNNSGECLTVCDDAAYKQDKFGNCNYCHSSYDGGMFKQPICGKATLCRPSCPYGFTEEGDETMCKMIEEYCNVTTEKPSCPCSKLRNVTVIGEDGEETIVEEMIGYYKNVEYEVNYNGRKQKKLRRECVDVCEKWESDPDLPPKIREIYERDKCYLCSNSSTVDHCDPPLVFNPRLKKCVGPGDCPEDMIPWQLSNGNWVCSINCEIKAPTNKTCAKVINMTVWELNE